MGQKVTPLLKGVGLESAYMVFWPLRKETGKAGRANQDLAPAIMQVILQAKVNASDCQEIESRTYGAEPVPLRSPGGEGLRGAVAALPDEVQDAAVFCGAVDRFLAALSGQMERGDIAITETGKGAGGAVAEVAQSGV